MKKLFVIIFMLFSVQLFAQHYMYSDSLIYIMSADGADTLVILQIESNQLSIWDGSEFDDLNTTIISTFTSISSDTIKNNNNATTTNIVTTDTLKLTSLTASRFLVTDSNGNMTTALILQGDLPLEAVVWSDTTLTPGIATPYDIDTDIATHTSNSSAHHVKTVDTVLDSTGIDSNNFVPDAEFASHTGNSAAHQALVTLTGQSYATLSTQEITFLPIRSVNVDSIGNDGLVTNVTLAALNYITLAALTDGNIPNDLTIDLADSSRASSVADSAKDVTDNLIVNAHINSSANIASSKLASDVLVESERTTASAGAKNLLTFTGTNNVVNALSVEVNTSVLYDSLVALGIMEKNAVYDSIVARVDSEFVDALGFIPDLEFSQFKASIGDTIIQDVDSSYVLGKGFVPIGAFTGNTETLITVTWQDGDKTLDFVVNPDLHSYSWTSVDATDLKVGSVTQAYNANLTTWAGIAPSVNVQSLVSAANYAEMRTFLDLEPGTDFYSITAADLLFGAKADTGSVGYLAQNETIASNWINTAYPWADNEVANDITLTNITQITNRAITNTTGNNWKVWYSNGSGAVTELALGASGTFLGSNGASSAPSFSVPAGAGNVSNTGTPANDQIPIWTDATTIEGVNNFKFQGSTLELFIVSDGDTIKFSPYQRLYPFDLYFQSTRIFAVDSSGNVVLNGTIDGRDLQTDGSKLDGIEASADVTDATNVATAGAVMDSDYSVSGIQIRTGAGTYTARTIIGDAELVVVDGSGISGNPTLSIASTLTRDTEIANFITASDSIVESARSDSLLVAGVYRFWTSLFNSQLDALKASDSDSLNGKPASYYTNLDNISDGTSYERVAAAELSSGIYKDATTSVKGIASFNTNDFTVSSGAVSEKLKPMQFSIDSANVLQSDTTMIWQNWEGSTVTIDSIRLDSENLDDYDLRFFRRAINGGSVVALDTVTASTNGIGKFYGSSTPYSTNGQVSTSQEIIMIKPTDAGASIKITMFRSK